MSASLLPKLSTEFSTKTYWQEFFTSRKDAFEWYGDYNTLSDILHRYCKSNEKLLIAGCGNSKLSEDLYDIGYHSIVNIDISEVVIKQMCKRNNEKRNAMKYLTMDVKNVCICSLTRFLYTLIFQFLARGKFVIFVSFIK